MSKRSQEKRRARAKEKKLNKRRMMGTSPLGRLAGDSDACECWVSYQSEDNRMRSLHVVRPVRGGGHVAAMFLIDFDCIGLKDAFYRLDVDVGELREMLRERSRQEEDLKFVKIPVEEARKLVAGAIRWTRAHRYFRMPAETERCVKILGGLDVEWADISEFGIEDEGLFYVGREADLRRRLVGMTVEEFMDMEGVEVEFHRGDEDFREEEFDEEWDEDDPDRPLMEEEREEMEEAEDTFAKVREQFKAKLLEGVRKWCFANARAPEPELEKAVDLMASASMEGLMHGEIKDEEELRDIEVMLKDLEDPADRPAIEKAERQLGEFVQSFGSEKAMLESLGMNELWQEDSDEIIEEDSENDERVMELADAMTDLCEQAMRAECAQRGVKPSRYLRHASKIRVASLLAGIAAIGEGKEEGAALQESAEFLLELAEQQEESSRDGIMRALVELFRCKGASPEVLIRGAAARVKKPGAKGETPAKLDPIKKES